MTLQADFIQIARSPRRPARRRAAPVWIRAFTAATVLATAAIAVVLSAIAGGVREDIAVLGERTAPQVTAAEDLYFALSDMDAQLANILLTKNDAGLTMEHTVAQDAYGQDRVLAAGGLQRAASVAGDDEDVQLAVRDVLDRFGRYQSLAAQAMALNDARRPFADVLVLQRQATTLMHSTLDIVGKLGVTNKKAFDQSYQDRRNTIALARDRLVVLGVVLVASLIGLQVVFRVRMRRRLNPAVIVATLVAGWLTIAGIELMNREFEYLRSAKEDAFSSLLVLTQARAVSHDALADQSRFLLDPEWSERYANDFQNKDARVTGYLADEGQNVTFPGEQQAVAVTTAAYEQYRTADQSLRNIVVDGDRHAAIKYCLDPWSNSSSHLFSVYDKALIDVIDINQRAFDTTVSAAEDDLTGWTGLLPYGAGVVIVLLVGVGIQPRLAEYR